MVTHWSPQTNRSHSTDLCGHAEAESAHQQIESSGQLCTSGTCCCHCFACRAATAWPKQQQNSTACRTTCCDLGFDDTIESVGVAVGPCPLTASHGGSAHITPKTKTEGGPRRAISCCGTLHTLVQPAASTRYSLGSLFSLVAPLLSFCIFDFNSPTL